MTENYGRIQGGRYSKIKTRITGAVIIVILIIAAAWAIGILAGNSAEYQERSSILRENHQLLEENAALKQQIEELQAQTSSLQGQVSERDAYIASLPTEAPVPEGTEMPTEGAVQTPSAGGNAVSPRGN
ncbi:MAG: hypothetical protein PUD92_02850 [Clostridiales bacterium]|nr:hypothetical protein [Clostridiales bacterium]